MTSMYKNCNNVAELLESCNKSYLHKQQDKQANFERGQFRL